MISLKNRTIAAAAAAIATLTTVAASAPAHAETLTAKVAYADLDLSTATGQSALDRRIRHAVDAVCGRADARDARRVAIGACRNQALRTAHADIRVVEARNRLVRMAAK